jgi:hypothetical protein
MNTLNERAAHKWIGLAHVRPSLGNTALGNSAGAYVAAVGLADNADTFARLVSEKLHEYDFQVVEVEDIELFERRSAKYEVDPEVTNMAESLNTENPVALATFHAYKS